MQMAYYREVEFDTTVIGGLPVTVRGTVYGSEVDEWWICAVAGRACKTKPIWVYKRMSADDREKIVEDVYEASRD